MIQERQSLSHLRKRFDGMDDAEGSGTIDLVEFIEAYQSIKARMSLEGITRIFYEADVDGNGELDYQKFVDVLCMHEVDVLRKLQ
jgi:Ca2+-binding EF-hand superfamily protein